MAVPHVAARRPHRGADGRLRTAGRDPAEDGDLRLHPHRPAHPAAGREDVGSRHRHPGGDRHRLRLLGVPGPA